MTCASPAWVLESRAAFTPRCGFQLQNGLAYNWHRHYDASLGRYVSSDPLGLTAMLSDGPANYNYAGQRPGVYVDPRGQFIPILIGIAAGLGAFGFADYANAPGRGDAVHPNEPFGPILQGGAAAATAAMPVAMIGGAAVGAIGTSVADSYLDACSFAHDAVTYGAMGVGGLRLAYAASAKVVSKFASSAESASSARNTLKLVFRGGLGGTYRRPPFEALLEKYGSHAAVRAKAGKTDPFFNGLGIGGVGAGLYGQTRSCTCQ